MRIQTTFTSTLKKLLRPLGIPMLPLATQKTHQRIFDHSIIWISIMI